VVDRIEWEGTGENVGREKERNTVLGFRQRVRPQELGSRVFLFSKRGGERYIYKGGWIWIWIGGDRAVQWVVNLWRFSR